MGDVGDRRIEAIVIARPGAEDYENREVQDWGEEGEEAGLAGMGDQVEDWNFLESSNRKGHVSNLGFDRAAVSAEVSLGALGGCVRVADDAGGVFDVDVFGILAVAGGRRNVLSSTTFERELGLKVGMAAGLRCGGGDGEGFNGGTGGGWRNEDERPHSHSHHAGGGGHCAMLRPQSSP